ncbi:MAG: PIN domain-containing protein [Candidatus Tectomicrobia bacterium]|nr:PIN domain-containing protein [Candidatus Tectomicrobia bacterium]
MIGPVFVDTNVFVYRHDNSVPAKQSCAEQWIRFLAESRTGRLSYQVLQELYATLTRPRLKFDHSEARRIVRLLSAWQPLAIDLGVLERAWRVQEHWVVSWWDALIIGAAQASECPVLLTEDLQAGQVFDGVTAVDPFTLANLTPEDVLNA